MQRVSRLHWFAGADREGNVQHEDFIGAGQTPCPANPIDHYQARNQPIMYPNEEGINAAGMAIVAVPRPMLAIA